MSGSFPGEADEGVFEGMGGVLEVGAGGVEEHLGGRIRVGSSAMANRSRCFCPPEHFLTTEPVISAIPARSRRTSVSREEAKIADV